MKHNVGSNFDQYLESRKTPVCRLFLRLAKRPAEEYFSLDVECFALLIPLSVDAVTQTS